MTYTRGSPMPAPKAHASSGPQQDVMEAGEFDIVSAYHKACGSMMGPGVKAGGWADIALSDSSNATDQNLKAAEVPISQQRRYFPSLTIISAPQPAVCDRPVPTRLAVVNGGLPTHQEAVAQGPVATAYAALRYAARVAHAVPKWVLRKGRPLLSKLSTINSRINAHRWVRGASRISSQGAQHAVTRFQGAIRVSNGLSRLGRNVSRYLPSALRKTMAPKRVAEGVDQV